MKRSNLILNLAVAAALAGAYGHAMAAMGAATVDLDAATGAAVYATEISYTDANPLVGAVAAPNFKAKIGFGISSGSTRYVRVQYSNATLDAAHGGALNTDIEDTTTTGNLSAAALVQGGAIGDNYAVYQITAGAALPATDVISVAVPNLRVTSTGSAVTVSFQLHETAVSAVAGSTGSGLLYSKSGDLATFASGLANTFSGSTQTAAVSTDFKKFCATSTSDCKADTAVTTKKLGIIKYDKSSTAKIRDGSAVALTDLVTTADIVVTGDFTAAAAAGSVFIDADNDTTECNTSSIAATLNSAKTTATFAVDTTAVAAANGPYLCYTVNGTTVLPTQTVTAVLNVKTKPTDTTTASTTSATVGTVGHDGTTLVAPLVNVPTGWLSRLVLANRTATAATYTVTATSETGITVTLNGAAASGSIAANKTTVIDLDTLMTATGGSFARGTLAVSVAAPASGIDGQYQLVNASTGNLSNFTLISK